MKNRFMLLAFVVLALVPIAAHAQSMPAPSFVPDNRYDGYPKSLIEWPKVGADLTACKDGEFYEPLGTGLVRYAKQVKIAGYRIQEYSECTWMSTLKKWRWVLRPKGTKVAIDAQGRDLFDYGSGKGIVCANPRPFSIPILDTAEPAPVVVPELIVVPPPVVAEEAKPFEFRTAPPPVAAPAPPPPPPVFVEGHHWPCTGKISRWVCIGAAGAVIGWAVWPDHHDAKAPPMIILDTKSGSPGGR